MHPHQPQDIPPWPQHRLQYYSHLLGTHFQHSNYESINYTNSGSISAMQKCYFPYSYKKKLLWKLHILKCVTTQNYSNRLDLCKYCQSICKVQCIYQLFHRLLINATSTANVYCIQWLWKIIKSLPCDSHYLYECNLQNLECDTLILHTITVRFTSQRKEYTIPTLSHSDYKFHPCKIHLLFSLILSKNSSVSTVTWL